MPQPQLLIEVLSLLDETHIDYMITGSFVSSLQGEPRATHDIDIVVNINESAIPALTNTFKPPRFYLSEIAIKEAIQYKSMFNLLDTNEGDKIDFWILTNDPFDQSRFSRKYKEDLGGIEMKMSRAEDTILMKLRWSNLSGGSEKQFNDALRVYEVQFGILDLVYIKQWTRVIKTESLWERLIKEAKPIT